MWISRKQKDALNKRLNMKFDELEERIADLEVQVQSQHERKYSHVRINGKVFRVAL